MGGAIARWLLLIKLISREPAQRGTKVCVGSDTPVTHNLKGNSLKSTLELLLGELDLTCCAEGNRLFVPSIDHPSRLRCSDSYSITEISRIYGFRSKSMRVCGI